MIVTKLLCPFVGCHAQATVKAPHDERAIDSARAALRRHRREAHNHATSLVDGRQSARWEYEVES